MSESTIARRYAQALFDLCLEEERVEEGRVELENFASISRENPALLEVLANRFLDAGQRLSIVDELGGILNLSKTVSNFIKLLVKKGRISLLQLVAGAYRRCAFEHQKISEVHLKSAIPLEASVHNQISSLLARATGKKIILKTEVDEGLLGGIWLKVGNDIYDGTVKADLAQLKNRMILSSV